MQCNQGFCGNGYTNGPFCSSFNTPLQSTQGMYPEIVGEGQVNSMILPDGSVQFFFMPTLKWWSPNATPCYPFQSTPSPMFANTNYSIPPPYNNNVGTWLIRSISNPIPQSAFNPPSQRNELLRLGFNTDNNHHFNRQDLGYEVKFHNDGGTSTTDLVYFYPSLRHRDFVFMPPCKDETVQIDIGPFTNNTVCHYQVVCSKPCNCSVGAKPMSLENIPDPNITQKINKPCNCTVGSQLLEPTSLQTTEVPNSTPKSNEPSNCAVRAQPMNLDTLVDPNLTTKNNKSCNYSADGKPMSLESLVKPNLTLKINNTSKDDTSYSKVQNKRVKDKKRPKIICGCDSEEKKKKRNKSSNIIWASDPKPKSVNVDKSITTYVDESVSCNPADGRETQTSRTEDITSQCDVGANPMNKAPLKKKSIDEGCCSDCSTCDERSCDDISDKKDARRDKGSKYKRSKPNKCNCGCCDCDSSEECGTASEVETVASKDIGRETSFTCSRCPGETVLEKLKGSPIKIAKNASIGKANSSLQWLTSDYLPQTCEGREKEGAGTVVPSAIPLSGIQDGKSPDNLLAHTSTEFHTAVSTCNGYKCEK